MFTWAAFGVSAVMVGLGGTGVFVIVKLNSADVPPPGEGVTAVTFAGLPAD